MDGGNKVVICKEFHWCVLKLILYAGFYGDGGTKICHSTFCTILKNNYLRFVRIFHI